MLTQQKRNSVVRTIKSYLCKTKAIRINNSQLLLSYIGPHEPISRVTLARWTINVLKWAGIDIEKYKADSTRGFGIVSTGNGSKFECYNEECLVERHSKLC